jgi:hypothetical protein
VNSTVQLRLVSGPSVLHREDGYTLWHGGITDGPHGLSLTLEVLDESGTGRMAGEQWQSTALKRWPVELTAMVPGGDPVRPHEIIEARSAHYYRLICTFGKYGRAMGPRPGPGGLELAAAVHPLGWHVCHPIR